MKKYIIALVAVLINASLFAQTFSDMEFFYSGNDTIPNSFNFTDQTNLALSTEYTSDSIVVNEIDGNTTTIYAGGGSYRKGVYGSWATAYGTVIRGDTIWLKATSSASYVTAVNTTLTIGGVSNVWSITTKADNDAPAAPTNLAAVGTTGTITLTWDANTEADAYMYYIYAGTSANPTSLLDSVAFGTETWDTTGLVGGTVNHFRIKCGDNSWNLSDYSSSVSDTAEYILLAENYKDRVIADGGSVISMDSVAKHIKFAQDSSYYDSTKCWVGASFGVKKDANNKVTKLYDLTINNNDVVRTDTSKSPTWVANSFNGKPSLLFDGVNDCMTINHSSSLNFSEYTGAISIAMWVKIDSSIFGNATQEKILTRDAGSPRLFDFTLHASNDRPYFYIWNVSGSFVSPTTADANIGDTWEFLSATFDTTNAMVYIDGVGGTPATLSGKAQTGELPIALGSSYYEDADFYKGYMDYLILSNKAFTGTVVSAIKNSSD